MFPGEGGITGLLLLTESHLACHTFPERGFAAFNLYCCRPGAEWPWPERLRVALGAETVLVRRLARGERGGHERVPGLLPLLRSDRRLRAGHVAPARVRSLRLRGRAEGREARRLRQGRGPHPHPVRARPGDGRRVRGRAFLPARRAAAARLGTG